MLHSRIKYFSNSNYAEYLRNKVGVNKPKYASSKEWHEWRTLYKSNHPYMYYFTEIMLDKIQNIIFWPKDIYKEIYNWYINKYKYRTHCLPTKLDVGKYHDIDIRLESGIFETFVQFVEIDLAHEYQFFIKKENTSRRSREDGVAMLEHRINEEKDCGSVTNYYAFTEIKNIYLYIKDHYERNDDDIIDPLYRYMMLKDEKYKCTFLNHHNYDRDELESYYFLGKQSDSLEQSDEELVDFMLIRILELRKYLWT